MLRVLRDEMRGIDRSRRALRSFGITVGAVLLIIAGVLLWRAEWHLTAVASGLAISGGLLALLGLVAPRILKPLHVAWMTLALILGYLMTRVILTLVFYAAVTPIGLVLRLFGKDPLDRTIDHEASTYWIPKSYDDNSPSRLEKYY